MSSNNQIQTTASYHDPELEKLIANRHYIEALPQAKLQGKADGIVLKPSLKGGNLKLFIEFLTYHYNHTLALVNDKLQGTLQLRLGGEERSSVATKRAALQKQIIQQEAEITVQERKLPDKQVTGTLFSFSIGMLFCAGIIFAEVVYMIRSLQLVVSNLIGATIFGIGLTCAIGFIGFFAEAWIAKNIQSILMRRIARISLAILLVSTFIVLGVLRNMFIQKTEGIESPIWFFVFINSILFIGLYFATEMWINPLLPELKEAIRIFKVRKKIARQKAEVKVLNNELLQNQGDLDNSLFSKTMVVAYQISLEDIIECQYHEAVSAYKRANIDIREDNDIPECFDQEAPPLIFFTHNIYMGGQNHEK